MSIKVGVVGAGNIGFSSILDGTTDDTETLTLHAGTGSVTFGGAVGSTKRLGTLTVSKATGGVTGNSTIKAASMSITDGGSVDLNGALWGWAA